MSVCTHKDKDKDTRKVSSLLMLGLLMKYVLTTAWQLHMGVDFSMKPIGQKRQICGKKYDKV